MPFDSNDVIASATILLDCHVAGRGLPVPLRAPESASLPEHVRLNNQNERTETSALIFAARRAPVRLDRENQ